MIEITLPQHYLIEQHPFSEENGFTPIKTTPDSIRITKLVFRYIAE
ncbi:hypothetical protein [Shimazuella alba]|uniref:Uncharacterized protein n=1 Tax=Shimazuella alba TaxID=2690964 RepID=A0A6I4VQ59_9BACL|nr:hypothetical protein [Shimazuella alba]MXQ52415.1 hypothetical protein [Shimazuella alba]